MERAAGQQRGHGRKLERREVTGGAEWRAVVGYEGLYEVSDVGQVRSVDRVVINRGFSHRLKGRELKQVLSRGYPSVMLSKGGKTRRWQIHLLVAKTFVPGTGEVVRHRNGVKTDARAENLEWGTQTENMADRIRHGTSNRGERHGNAKLTREQIAAIKVEYARGGISQRVLGLKYGVRQTTVLKIVRGQRWNWLEGTA